jgi:hypothetical protein
MHRTCAAIVSDGWKHSHDSAVGVGTCKMEAFFLNFGPAVFRLGRLSCFCPGSKYSQTCTCV